MSVLSFFEKSFGADNYAKYRPEYPQKLLQYVVQYHKSQNIVQNTEKKLEITVDVACGTGQATRLLSEYSTKVVGVDFSEPMIKKAREIIPNLPNVEFIIGNDVTLTTKFAQSSVDLITVAEGAHWLSYPEFWRQAAQLLRPGGTIAIWGYSTFTFPEYPETAQIIEDFTHGKDYCGPYWNQGREILDDMYIPLVQSLVMEPDFCNIEYHSNPLDKLRPNETFELVQNDVPLYAVANMLKTWSPYFNHCKAHPEGPDIVDLSLNRILAATGLSLEDTVQVKWSTAYLLATKRA